MLALRVKEIGVCNRFQDVSGTYASWIRVAELSLAQTRGPLLVDDGSIQVIRISHGGNEADDCVRPRHVDKEAFSSTISDMAAMNV